MEIQYIGEHLLPGQTGKIFINLSFVTALLSSLCYFISVKAGPGGEVSWKKIARSSFILHGISVFGIMGTLFYMLYNHMFEYSYVWQHSSSKMELKYIFSCFWEGQEGSFLLWTVWHVVLGGLLLFTSGKWEGPVMSVVCIVQAFLASMLLGIYFGEIKIGSNPFILLRENPQFANIPLFQNANYLQNLDGRGLNPLLQNYWMTIHPPTLFLGFSLVLVPFAYAIGGLWTNRLREWQDPAQPWTFAGIAVLGTGILMGGAWAYEALSFGGFWAWDPVENASLVPWIMLVGGAHIMIVSKKNRGSLFSTFFFILSSFILVLYSTFLTRSGILGESSVHSFTDLGMSGQLLLYLIFFVCLSAGLLITDKRTRNTYFILSAALILLSFAIGYKRYLLVAFGAITLLALIYSYVKFFPKEKEEEALWSREFWMFIGSLILLISSAHIIITTSNPVINKILGTSLAKVDIPEYNKWQSVFASFLTLVIGAGQFLKYKGSDIRQVGKKLMIPAGAAALITLFFIILLQINNPFHIPLLFTSMFCVFANGTYWISVLKGKIKNAGASIAHTGFGLLIAGALISAGKKQTISQNSSLYSVTSLGEDFSDQKNILLQKDDTLKMGDYHVTYKGKKKEGINVLYEVEYLKKNADKYERQFTLFPRVQTNPMMGNVAEPDTRHFLAKDIYTHVSYAELETEEEKNKNSSEYLPAQEFPMKPGDTAFAGNAILILEYLNLKIDKNAYNLSDSILAVGAVFKIFGPDKKTYQAMPVYTIRGNSTDPIEAKVDELGLKLLFWKINPDAGTIEISLSEKRSNKKDFIVMEAHIFPLINMLWTGCVVMLIGTVIAVVSRVRKPGNSQSNQ